MRSFDKPFNWIATVATASLLLLFQNCGQFDATNDFEIPSDSESSEIGSGLFKYPYSDKTEHMGELELFRTASSPLLIRVEGIVVLVDEATAAVPYEIEIRDQSNREVCPDLAGLTSPDRLTVSYTCELTAPALSLHARLLAYSPNLSKWLLVREVAL